MISRRKRLAIGEGLELPEHVPDESAECEPERAADRIDVVRAVTALTPDERLLIELRYQHDWSHPDIAGRLGVPVATARVRLHRAQKRLRELLSGGR